ncbi:MAG: hypothetical protein ABI560_01400 [Myxococcales bacterium]
MWEVLASWEEQYRVYDADVARFKADPENSGFGNESQIDGYFSSYQLGLGARFVAEFARRVGDIDLLGKVTKIAMEMDALSTIARDEEDKEEEARNEADERRHAYFSARLRLCTEFLDDSQLKVDTSRLLTLVEERAADFEKDELRRLRRYLNEQSERSRIHDRIRRNLGDPESGRLPTLDEYQAAFEQDLADYYRRAEKHVSGKLAQLPLMAEGKESNGQHSK